MKLGFIGLGKMGYHMVKRLADEGHEIVVFDKSSETVDAISGENNIIPSFSLADLAEKLSSPRTIWIMIPHIFIDETINELLPLLLGGDLIIDGGNSRYTESMARSELLDKKNIRFMDIGVSGGLVGSKYGYCMMAGGKEEDFLKVEPILKSMCVKDGYGYIGKNGSGHYVKMIHNAIEYGMMQSIGEGLDLLKNGPFPETDQVKLTELWNNGSIIRSFLLQMANLGLKHNPGLETVDGFVPNSGEGKWAVEDAEKYNVSIPVITQSLKVRLESDTKKNYGTKTVAVMRDEFGGHGVTRK